MEPTTVRRLIWPEWLDLTRSPGNLFPQTTQGTLRHPGLKMLKELSMLLNAVDFRFFDLK